MNIKITKCYISCSTLFRVFRVFRGSRVFRGFRVFRGSRGSQIFRGKVDESQFKLVKRICSD